MRWLALALLLLAPHITAASAAGQETREPRARRVDSLFAELDRSGSPGLAVAVVRDGQVVFTKGYGLASLEHRVPNTPATVFDVASVSKQFAGLAIAMLVEQGRINLRDDVRKYIPELPDIGRTITIDHLLHHTSGLRDWPGTLAVAGWRFDDVISFDQILSMAYGQRTLNFVPGAEYTYSNTGYNLLAETVARVTGQSFRAWTDEHLFRPLGMANTHFRDDHTKVIANRAFGYARSDSGFRAVTNNLTALGSSSLFSTADDMAKWVINFDTRAVGGPAAMALTRTRGVLNDGTSIPYAFGVSHGEYRGLPTVSHSGGWASFGSFVVHFPAQRFGVVVLANNGGVNASRAAYNIADIFLADALAPPARAAATTPVTATVHVPAALLDEYAGVYRLGPGWYLRISREGGALKTQATRESAFPMTARSRTEFWVDGYGAAISFGRDAAGRVTHALYRGRNAPKLTGTTSPSTSQMAEYAGEYASDELQTRYTVEATDSSLMIRHHRHGLMKLTRAWGDDFTGSAWFMRSMEFERDPAGRVIGFAITVDERSRNIRFVKRR